MGKAVSQTEGIENVKQSMWHILSTKMGSRIGRRSFGSRLFELVQEVNDSGVFDPLADHYTREALLTWEKRIEVGPIKIDRSKRKDGRVEIQVSFVIKKTQQPGMLVYPYYVEGGRSAA
jgi:phage baseplate assembly protein W